jgi:hypothetical protein
MAGSAGSFKEAINPASIFSDVQIGVHFDKTELFKKQIQDLGLRLI